MFCFKTFEWLLLDYPRPPSTFTGSRILFANKTKLSRHQRDNKLLIRKPEWKKNNSIITVIYIIAVEHEIEKFN
jgi:hypothetical protein